MAKRGKQIIRKKQQAVSSDYRRKISSHWEKNSYVGSFEFLKQIMEMVIEQTVCLVKRQITLKALLTAAILGQTKGPPGPIFCVPTGSLGNVVNKTSIYSMFSMLSPKCFQFKRLPELHVTSVCLITPSRFLFHALVHTLA